MLTEPETIDLNDVPCPRDGLCCRPMDDEAVLYDPAHHILHYLNRTAHAIWNHCDGQRSVADIARAIADAFTWDADTQTIRATVIEDVCHTLTDLADNGLIELHRRSPHDTSDCHPCTT